MKRKWLGMALLLLTAFVGITTASALTEQEQLGKDLFFDENLSEPKGQDCAACHGQEVGFTGPNETINENGAVYEGAVPGRFGNRKPPSAAYAGGSPVLALLMHNIWTGGMFWDGRATGQRLGDPLAEQAQGPFLNPLEQNLPNATEVVSRVEASNYSELFNKICNTSNTADAYDCIGKAIAAYERSIEVTSFTSKFDTGKFSDQEKRGLNLFRGKAKCNGCHVSTGKNPTFTDYTYDNIGIPRNPDNPFYEETTFNPLGAAWIDQGLGGFLNNNPENFMVAKTEIGKFKVPTLRNVAKGSCEAGFKPCITKAYGHNGYFKSLKEIVHFYNTRDVLPVCGGAKNNPGVDCWPLSEEGLNINTAELGNLGLTSAEEGDIVAFLGTLSDS